MYFAQWMDRHRPTRERFSLIHHKRSAPTHNTQATMSPKQCLSSKAQIPTSKTISRANNVTFIEMRKKSWNLKFH